MNYVSRLRISHTRTSSVVSTWCSLLGVHSNRESVAHFQNSRCLIAEAIRYCSLLDSASEPATNYHFDSKRCCSLQTEEAVSVRMCNTADIESAVVCAFFQTERCGSLRISATCPESDWLEI